MADIKINDIQPAGMELFGGDESFIDDMSDDDISQVFGGAGWTVLSVCASGVDCITCLSVCRRADQPARAARPKFSEAKE